METKDSSGLQSVGATIRGHISHALAVLAFCYSLLTLFGWWFDIDWLQRIIPNLVPIHPHTSTTLLLLSFALALSPWTKQWQQRIAMTSALLTVAVGCFRIIATLSGRSLWVGDPWHGVAVMALSTAMVFVCLGIACLCTMASEGRNRTIAIVLAFVALGFGCMTLFGHLFQATAMYAVAGQVMA